MFGESLLSVALGMIMATVGPVNTNDPLAVYRASFQAAQVVSTTVRVTSPQGKVQIQTGGGAQPGLYDEKLLASNYNLKLSDPVLYSGYLAWRVEVNPKRAGNPRRTVFVDKASYLQLGVEDYDGDGGLLQKKALLSVGDTGGEGGEEHGEGEGGASSGPVSYNSLRGAKALSAAEQRRLGLEPRPPKYLPEGYRLFDIHLMDDGRTVSAHSIYFDGLGVISLFQWAVPWWAKAPREPQPGRTIEWEEGAVHYVLVGDVSTAELAKIARSVK